MSSEEFRLIEGFPYHRVSNRGRVQTRYHRNHLTDGWRDRNPVRLWRRGGYLQISLKHEGNHRQTRVHILVLEAFVGPCPPGMECRHLDGNPANNRIENLAWGTDQENQDDRRIHGTMLLGTNNPSARYREDEIRTMRRLHAEGMSYGAIARMFKTHSSAIRTIVLRRTWAHIA